LNQVFVFVGADPSWAGSEGRGVLSGHILNDVVLVGRAHDIERAVGLLVGLLGVGNFVEVVVNDFSKIDQGILLNLNFSLLVDLDAGGVHDAKIANVVFSILADDHELALPQLLVVRNLIVVGLTLANLEDTLGAINSDAKSLELLSVDGLEGHMEL
jgi:hypothetical protein